MWSSPGSRLGEAFRESPMQDVIWELSLKEEQGVASEGGRGGHHMGEGQRHHPPHTKTERFVRSSKGVGHWVGAGMDK